MERISRGEVMIDKKFGKGDFVLTHSVESAMLIIDDMIGEGINGENYFDGTYQCAWLDNNQDLKFGFFREDDLVKTNGLTGL